MLLTDDEGDERGELTGETVRFEREGLRPLRKLLRSSSSGNVEGLVLGLKKS